MYIFFSWKEAELFLFMPCIWNHNLRIYMVHNLQNVRLWYPCKWWVDILSEGALDNSTQLRFHYTSRKRILCTPPRTSEVNEKNWRTKARPFLTSHLWYKAIWKHKETPWSPLGSTSYLAQPIHANSTNYGFRIIFEIGNWLWKSNFGTFWHLPINPILKIQ